MAAEAFLAPPKPPPALNIPPSTSTVKLSIIDSTSRLILPMKLFCQPEIKGNTELEAPAYSYLIEHPSGRKLLFDLGVRKDWENAPPRIVNLIKSSGWSVSVTDDVAGILEAHGIKRDAIDAIVWSHYHWDHTGDPSMFPASTDLIVGPGFKANFTPGWPTNPDAPVRESDWAGRTLREISFNDGEGNGGLKIGRFNALDYFADGSFYLLDTPGHAIGHMCGLARVTSGAPDSFVFMGGDACHHCGEFRPTEYLPLPKELDPSPVEALGSVYPGHVFQDVHPRKSSTEPYYDPSEGVSHDVELARWTIRGVEEFDAQENVLVGMAHDGTLLGVVDFFPECLNSWKEKGFGAKARWRFLKDFREAIGGSSE